MWTSDGESLRPAWRATLPGALERVDAGDLDGDGTDDLVAIGDRTLVLWLGPRRRTDPGCVFVIARPDELLALAVDDFDGDSEAEVAVSDASRISVLGVP